MRMREKHIVIHPDKRPSYVSELEAAEIATSMCRDELNSLAHKLIYCSSIIVRMRPWLFPIFRCLYARTRTARALLSNEARTALRRCRLALQSADDHPLPFAATEAFPLNGDDIVALYADAAGDGEDPGWGFWWVMGNTLFFAHGIWSAAQLRLPIHALELWASSAGLMTLRCVVPSDASTYVLEYTDNAASEFVGDSQQSRCPLLQCLIAARGDFFDATGMCALPQRVSSAHNSWADWLSRNRLNQVIASAVRLGLRPCEVALPREAWTLLDSLARLSDT